MKDLHDKMQKSVENWSALEHDLAEKLTTERTDTGHTDSGHTEGTAA